ncbi:hypothetical protein ABEB36_000356 [Hypothenemus hampei]|uniref:Uncharacterized protein n=1 Tax=Hypothenemus hampei TaxID=57062 RepID=A0ABD1FEK3_HYPHA
MMASKSTFESYEDFIAYENNVLQFYKLVTNEESEPQIQSPLSDLVKKISRCAESLKDASDIASRAVKDLQNTGVKILKDRSTLPSISFKSNKEASHFCEIATQLDEVAQIDLKNGTVITSFYENVAKMKEDNTHIESTIVAINRSVSEMESLKKVVKDQAQQASGASSFFVDSMPTSSPIQKKNLLEYKS